LDATQRKRVERIRGAGVHLLELINDLLDVSRIQTGSLRLQLKSVNLYSEVQAALRLASGPALARQVSLQLNLAQAADELNLWVSGDSIRLRQVVLNLLTNAIKYNRPRGKVLLQLSREVDEVVLKVIDTGFGMNDVQLQALFEPFNRLGQEQSTNEGAGIGLVIAKHLVELMGGALTASSQPRVGTEYCARFKAAQAPPGASLVTTESAASKPTAPEHEPQPGQRAGHYPGRVLYIEDNLVNRALIEGYASLRPRVALEMAVDGESGIAAALRQTPDLILIDMMLPDMHGMEVLANLRRHEHLQSVRCLAVSANAMPEQIEAAAAAGFDGYLTKPVPLQQMLAELDKLV
jgi:hypothetical protein